MMFFGKVLSDEGAMFLGYAQGIAMRHQQDAILRQQAGFQLRLEHLRRTNKAGLEDVPLSLEQKELEDAYRKVGLKVVQ